MSTSPQLICHLPDEPSPLTCHPSAWRWQQQSTLAFGAKSLVISVMCCVCNNKNNPFACVSIILSAHKPNVCGKQYSYAARRLGHGDRWKCENDGNFHSSDFSFYRNKEIIGLGWIWLATNTRNSWHQSENNEEYHRQGARVSLRHTRHPQTSYSTHFVSTSSASNWIARELQSLPCPWEKKNKGKKLEMLRSIVSRLTSPISSASVICNPNLTLLLSLYYSPITNEFTIHAAPTNKV